MNIRNIGVPEEEEKDTGVEGLCELIKQKTFLTWGKTQISKSRKYRGLPFDSTKTGHQQGIS